MSKLVSVALLQAGDRFEFVSLHNTDRFADSPNREHPNMMVVALDPKVNRAANSCFFRYKAESNPVESRSWNGTADIEVRIFTDRDLPTSSAAPVETPRAAEPITDGFSLPAPTHGVLAEIPDPPKEKAPRKSTKKSAAASSKTTGEKKSKAAADKEDDETPVEKKPTPKKLSAKSSITIKRIAPTPTPAPVRESSATPAVRKAVKPALKKKA